MDKTLRNYKRNIVLATMRNAKQSIKHAQTTKIPRATPQFEQGRLIKVEVVTCAKKDPEWYKNKQLVDGAETTGTEKTAIKKKKYKNQVQPTRPRKDFIGAMT